MANAPRGPQAERAPVERVDAPLTQTKTMKRLPPSFALGWLHLLPDSAFPIRSRDDMAVKISAVLLGPASAAEAPRTGLPARAQPQPDKMRGAR